MRKEPDGMICVFCGQEVKEPVCKRCNEYEGIEDADRCECGELVPRSFPKCDHCGRKNRHHAPYGVFAKQYGNQERS